jgi:hypothetical protein
LYITGEKGKKLGVEENSEEPCLRLKLDAGGTEMLFVAAATAGVSLLMGPSKTRVYKCVFQWVPLVAT